MSTQTTPTSHPYAAEDAALARKSWLAAHATPKAAILAGKLLNLILTGLLIYLVVALQRSERARGNMPVMIVRVNDVGRAEAVRLDKDYIPNEPELRDQLERFTIRYYTRHGFSIPEAIESLPLYLSDALFQDWRKEAMEALSQIAVGNGLKRVRILSCRIDNPSLAKTTGTTATIRIATDDLSQSGAVLPQTAQGYEVTVRFKIGMYPTTIKDDAKKDQWVVRNPLGIKVMDIQRTRYIGSDVEDHDMERVIETVNAKVQADAHRADLNKNTAPATVNP